MGEAKNLEGFIFKPFTYVKKWLKLFFVLLQDHDLVFFFIVVENGGFAMSFCD
jgi:hypothetical protein